MPTNDSSYYAEISILVDGWPWNLSEFDFRSWFAPDSCPTPLRVSETMRESAPHVKAVAVSENRRGNRRQKRNKKAGRKAA
jgi:hypothetical protein